MTETLTPNYLNVTGDTTIGEASEKLNLELKRLGLWDELDYFSTEFELGKDTLLKDVLPSHFNWIAVWATPGNSEGDYIHVELVGQCESLENRRKGYKLSRCVFLGKTFMGMEFAQKVVHALTVALSW